MLCLSIKPSNYEELKIQIEKAENTGNLVEIRVDALAKIDIEQLKKIINHTSLPVLLTLRSREQGGHWAGSVREMEKTLLLLADLNPQYIDIEHYISTTFIKDLQRRNPKVKIVLSYHDLNSTPDNIHAILTQMRQTPAKIYKIATTAHSTIDALRMLLFSKEAGSDTIAIAMGNDGAITRILAPLVNTPWSYACLSTSEQTAVGQLSGKQLQKIYNYSFLSPKTTVYGLIGDPITFSIGEIAHNAVYQRLGIDAVYVKMRVLPHELKDCLFYAQKLCFQGLSVTIPHKETIIKHLPHIDHLASKIAAVNTLTLSNKGFLGSNTDAIGALDAIEQHQRIDNLHLLIIGAGGSARALAYEGKRRGAIVTVASRRPQQATELANKLNIYSTDLSSIPSEYDFLVNTTPSELPITHEQILPHTIVMDLKCKPQETQLLTIAKEKNCSCIYGTEMFTRQAAKQLETWSEDSIAKNIQNQIFPVFLEVVQGLQKVTQ